MLRGARAGQALTPAPRPQSAPSFACFVEGALVDTWSGGNSQRLHAAIARYGSGANAANAR